MTGSSNSPPPPGNHIPQNTRPSSASPPPATGNYASSPQQQQQQSQDFTGTTTPIPSSSAASANSSGSTMAPVRHVSQLLPVHIKALNKEYKNQVQRALKSPADSQEQKDHYQRARRIQILLQQYKETRLQKQQQEQQQQPLPPQQQQPQQQQPQQQQHQQQQQQHQQQHQQQQPQQHHQQQPQQHHQQPQQRQQQQQKQPQPQQKPLQQQPQQKQQHSPAPVHQNTQQKSASPTVFSPVDANFRASHSPDPVSRSNSSSPILQTTKASPSVAAQQQIRTSQQQHQQPQPQQQQPHVSSPLANTSNISQQMAASAAAKPSRPNPTSTQFTGNYRATTNTTQRIPVQTSTSTASSHPVTTHNLPTISSTSNIVGNTSSPTTNTSSNPNNLASLRNLSSEELLGRLTHFKTRQNEYENNLAEVETLLKTKTNLTEEQRRSLKTKEQNFRTLRDQFKTSVLTITQEIQRSVSNQSYSQKQAGTTSTNTGNVSAKPSVNDHVNISHTSSSPNLSTLSTAGTTGPGFFYNQNQQKNTFPQQNTQNTSNKITPNLQKTTSQKQTTKQPGINDSQTIQRSQSYQSLPIKTEGQFNMQNNQTLPNSTTSNMKFSTIPGSTNMPTTPTSGAPNVKLQNPALSSLSNLPTSGDYSNLNTGSTLGNSSSASAPKRQYQKRAPTASTVTSRAGSPTAKMSTIKNTSVSMNDSTGPASQMKRAESTPFLPGYGSTTNTKPGVGLQSSVSSHESHTSSNIVDTKPVISGNTIASPLATSTSNPINTTASSASTPKYNKTSTNNTGKPTGSVPVKTRVSTGKVGRPPLSATGGSSKNKPNSISNSNTSSNTHNNAGGISNSASNTNLSNLGNSNSVTGSNINLNSLGSTSSGAAGTNGNNSGGNLLIGPSNSFASASVAPLPSIPMAEKVYNKRKIHELIKDLTPEDLEGITDNDVDELIGDLVEGFVDNVTKFACRLAKHRKSNHVDIKDLQLHLERNWNIRVPGYLPDEVPVIKRPVPTKSYVSRSESVDVTKYFGYNPKYQAPNGAPLPPSGASGKQV